MIIENADKCKASMIPKQLSVQVKHVGVIFHTDYIILQLSEVYGEWWISQFTVAYARLDNIKLETLRPHETKKLNTRIR